ncbi:alkylation response protein AidB-like acyl-CoA dehydrogenase [Neomicrococcus aestuarii]|uniref:Alkylation response protein AidB-like acyl-CoA dehydrogenase n=1 Tax=Neomicrococcus aestuarii TaxID=556325 RepID=A0A7W8WZP9_9MICC|nr:acyl-CoA dehydrogenase family protein [Neomicrococcus aestuarii]MBB5512555.1 alkylation response protein AidB-like acyl-CoA dehydrogenase [Neomicrococcus aestuarii]
MSTQTVETTSLASALDKYRPVFDRIAAGAVDRELNGELPHEPIQWLKESGFTAARVPQEFGGGGLTWEDFTALLIELAAADSNLPQALRSHVAFVEENLYHHGQVLNGVTDDRSAWFKRFVYGEIAGNAWTEPGQGGVATVLEERDGKLLLNGTKFYTTGTIFAEWIDVFAKRPDGSDISVYVSTKTDGIETFDDWDGFGQKGTGSGTTVFKNAPVDPENVYDFGFRFPYQAALYQHILLIALSGIAHGAAREVALQVKNRKRVFGHGNANLVSEDPQILQVVGEVTSKAYVAEAATLRVGRALDRAYESRTAGDAAEKAANIAVELESGQAQVVLVPLVTDAAGQIFNTLGASSTSTAKALDRYWRNARTVATHNPYIYKARVNGDWAVNGTEPPTVWSIGEAGVDEKRYGQAASS